MNQRLNMVLCAVSVMAAALFTAANPITASMQDAGNSGSSKAANAAATLQGAHQKQAARSDSGNDRGGTWLAGGGGNLTPQDQHLGQKAGTEQQALSLASASQHNQNVDAPVAVEGGPKHKGNDSWGPWGWDSADQAGFNHASSRAGNAAFTGQLASQGQWSDSSSGNSDCWSFCTGGGGNLTPQSQDLGQKANTEQGAESAATAGQQLLNVNVPITIVGWGSVGTAGGSATQVASNDATSSANNQAATLQAATQGQQASSSSGNSGCAEFCTGGGGNLTPQDQNLNQSANTSQQAASAAAANQKVMNVNVPVTIVGWGSVGTAGGSANQAAANSASSSASNAALTAQLAAQGQKASSSSGNTGCSAYCTGGGGNLTPQSQSLGQHAGTSQGATSLGSAHQGASNTASPVTVG